MPDVVTELAERGRALAPQDRSRLVGMLLGSLHQPTTGEIEAAWNVEVERRLDEYDRGEVQAIEAEEVFAKARSIAR
jgi:putative addiction module component (TIGR02574 family)